MMKESSIDDIIQAGEQITEKLASIREEVGASLVPGSYQPGEYIITSDQILQNIRTGGENSPIIDNDGYCNVYIKEQDYPWSKSAEKRCYVQGKKVHFYYCSTLQRMARLGRTRRYHVSPEAKNRYSVNFSDQQNVEVHLAWCQYCIQVMEENSRIFRNDRQRGTIARRGNAVLCRKCVIALHGWHGGRELPDDILAMVKDFFGMPRTKKRP